MELAQLKSIEENSNIFNLLYSSENTQLIVIHNNGNINFIGNVSNKNKRLIQETLSANEYYEVGNNLYRLVLDKSIYLFKKYESNNIKLLIGTTIKKTDETRLRLIDKQTEHLLQKSRLW